MEGVGIVSNDGHVLFVRQRKETQVVLISILNLAKFQFFYLSDI